MTPASSASIDRTSPTLHRNLLTENGPADRPGHGALQGLPPVAVTASTPVAIVIADFCTTGGMDMANFALADYLGPPAPSASPRCPPRRSKTQ